MSTNTLSSTAKLGDAKLPACKADGTNWIFFRDRFLFAVDAAGLSDHFEDTPTGTAIEPAAPAVVDPNQPTAEESRAMAEYLQRRRFWKSKQAVIKQGIAPVIPDSLMQALAEQEEDEIPDDGTIEIGCSLCSFVANFAHLKTAAASAFLPRLL
ncbi:hypothetical protein B0H13DRAFT_2333783 [Mycena leptocephala]|nr:hypothetical protein B0H13DRAFT_2333783 [Mycena leptocephala]